jgi:hypothetical protein
MAKVKLSKVVDTYVKTSRGKENMPNTEKDGLDLLIRRTGDTEVVCYTTDKSGRMAIDSPDNYIASMPPHITDMITTDQADYDNVEKDLNEHMSAW